MLVLVLFGGEMGKSFWAILAVVVIASVGLIFLSGSGDNNKSNNNAEEILTVQTEDHKRGLSGASVVLTEFSDFQCSACAAIFPVIDQMFREFGDRVEFVARSFPLVSIHPNSMSAHRAAEAAGTQGAFWEMHDILYVRQQSWSSASNAISIFESYANELGLDIEKYKTDAKSQVALERINTEAAGGTQLGVKGTPTFYLNDTLLPTPRTIEEFRTVLQNALDAASSTTAEVDTTP